MPPQLKLLAYNPPATLKRLFSGVKMCGATLPDSLQKIVERYADNKPAMMEAGIYYAVNQILDLLANDMHGIHLYTMNNPEVAKKICAGIQHLI